MNDREAFLLLLSYLLPFGGIIHIIWGIDIGDSYKIALGTFFLFFALFIMGYLLYRARKEKRLLKYNTKKTRLLIGMFTHILTNCALMIIEYLILRHFGFGIRYIIAIVCLSLVITTIIGSLLKKL